ncbi:interferon-related developmental regulator 1-like [Tachypleus tridentatus]|uniref:interferon-related developmental regulator 1-like n=1 Tax=Tachypleus tridentatus TaxID=6853 RepID=UPI003FD287D2
MPKGKRGKSKSGGRTSAPKLDANLMVGSEEESNFDNASIISNVSESRFGSDDGTWCEEVEDGAMYDDFEEKLKEAIDGTTQKSTKGRLGCLETIRKAFTSKYMYDFVIERKITVTDMLERSLKKGKGEEQEIAAILTALVSIHLGVGNECETLFHEIGPIFSQIVADPTASCLARAKCATALGLCSFITSSGVSGLALNMQLLHTVFSGSFLKGNGAVPSHSPEVATLHSHALLAWCLLVTILSTSQVLELAASHLQKLSELLESPNLELRIAAGETIAVLYEVMREIDEEFEGDNIDELCVKLQQLATDSQKFRAKKDRRQQRSSFRDVLRAVEEGESPDVRVKFGREILYIDSWCKKRQYDALCYVLGSGMNLHLKENELLRDIFELGAPVSNGGMVQKISKFDRHMVNVAACKARTKSRGKLRDKRADVIG